MTLLYVLMLKFHRVKTTPSIFLLPSVLFGYDADAVMAVSHHDDMDTYKGYIVHSACVEHTLKNLLCVMASLEFKCCNIWSFKFILVSVL